MRSITIIDNPGRHCLGTSRENPGIPRQDRQKGTNPLWRREVQLIREFTDCLRICDSLHSDLFSHSRDDYTENNKY